LGTTAWLKKVRRRYPDRGETENGKGNHGDCEVHLGISRGYLYPMLREGEEGEGSITNPGLWWQERYRTFGESYNVS